jgi:dynein regulatory complex protein 1
MQTLEKCMEDMKAIFKLNDEKLRFNFRVLREREKVNKSTSDNLKKKKAEVLESVRNERTKYDKQHKEY